MINKVCDYCQEHFLARENRNKYCNRKCYAKMKQLRGDRVVLTEAGRNRIRQSKMGELNPMFGKKPWDYGKKRPEITGVNNAQWNGGRFITGDYAWLSVDGEDIREHRKIMEDYLGRKLLPTEIIHHINHDKTDNRIENLMVVTRSEHRRIHPPVRRV